MTTLLMALVASASTSAAINPTTLLEKVDVAMNTADDISLSYEMLDQQPGKGDRRLAMDVLIKGEKRMTAFKAPADLKGTRVLILSPTRMYIYLPAYRKVRRIASHVTEQGFMGTTYSNDDLALSRFSDKYTATLVREDEKHAVLSLTQKPGADAPYAKVQLKIDKKLLQPVELVYSNASGEKLKTEIRDRYDCESGVCAPGRLRMEDHRSPGHVSTLERKSWKPNSGLSDSKFTVRQLQRGR